MENDHLLPNPPTFTNDDWQKCRDSGDYCPMLFEWYKFVGALSIFFASIRPDSPAVRPINRIHYAVLIGLLNRCSRLMLANVALSHEGLFGETTSIVDRCIFESCVKVCWLCENASTDKFNRFLADGLKTELELREKIQKNVGARGGEVLQIESRMLASIARYVASSGLTDNEIVSAKKLPDIAAMIEALGQDRLMYVVGQRIGSHHVHGTWPSLRMHYLEDGEDGMLMPRDHNSATHVNQYVVVPLLVIDVIKHYVRFIFLAEDDTKPVISMLESVEDEITKINTEVIGTDFERVEGI
jgi:hypothetical protein